MGTVTYERGDKVLWWSEHNHKDISKAVFVRYDKDFPKQDAILAFKIGKFVQTFRWPLRLMSKLD